MKYLSIILFTLFISTSCCGAKVVKEKASEKIAQIEAPKISESPKTSEIIIEEVQQPKEVETETIIEKPIVEDIVKAEKIIIKPQEAFNHSAWNDLLQKYVSNQGNVNYKGFKTEHTALKNYIQSLSKNTPTETWTRADKLAYWMNAYNALTVDLIVRHYPLKSIKDINSPWGQRLWKLGSKWYNLEEIEHQILRKMNEPRIHFGIVCASISCPKLQNTAFEASKIEAQLNKATKEFLADTTKNNLSKNSIKISKIFKWFSSDFKENGSLVDFINKYSEIVISQNASKSYKDYDWNLNE
ncbi:MAG: DUF547 domain-containing protein [Bacteroidetes bacterium]|nr:DUF547 domain-containing protein [Bacteroidota bacterium]